MSGKLVAKSICGAILAVFLVTSSAEQAHSGNAARAAVGIGAAVIIGCASGALNCKKKRSRSRARAPKRSGISAAQREQNRNVQSALNAFGWPVGAVDGVLGKRSRAAVRDYQGYMGYPQTGQLTDWERDALVNGWRKFSSGAGNAYPRTMAAVGPRGLLNAERDPNYPAQFGDPVGPNYNTAQGDYQPQNNGNWNQASTGHGIQNNQAMAFQPQIVPQQIPQRAVEPAPIQEAATQSGQLAGAVSTLPLLKPLKPLDQATVSSAARCETVNQTTRTQGGVIQAQNMTNYDQALSEKFCEARDFSITQGQSVATQYAVSESELTELCKRVSTGFADVINTLPTGQPAQVTAVVQSTASQLGLSDAGTASAYGQICISIGYRLDNEAMALSGALVMLAAGQTPYGEIVGHHLREGFGVTKTPVAAMPWYTSAIEALEQNATPAILPGTTPERIKVIRAALKLESQRADNTQGLPKLIPASATLPTLQAVSQ